MVDRYQEALIEGVFDPLSVVSHVVRSGALTGYVAYERDQCFHLAGNPVGEVTVNARTVRATMGGAASAEPWTGTPWRQVHAALRRSPVAGWNAYGWASFELASLPGGQSPDTALAHFIIPGVELRVTGGSVLIRAVDPADLARVRAVLDACPPPLEHRPTPVDVRAWDEAYLRDVAHAVEEIRKGRLRKVILSRRVPVPFPVDMCATYVLGRSHNTPARSFLLDLGGWQIAGFSPETVIEVDAGRLVSTQPLAGTRARTGRAADDHALGDELSADPKEVFEHATSVKLAFDELDAVGERGATRVSEFLTIKLRGSVQHLASRVVTTLAGDRNAWDALGAVFPAVTASGIPKRAAYRLIGELEDQPRGVYAGAVIMADAAGTLDAALVLRAVYQREGRAWLRAGAGIVAMSRPEREHEETSEKLSSVAPYLVAAPRHSSDVVPGSPETTRLEAAPR
ncbi:salicylate synthase [Nonomuraea sp. H19]|uniref:salicylate synthase n=1 Tax=Nonomuraea sp. H19 TaxID=3452206 RepID=UPI003F8B5496